MPRLNNVSGGPWYPLFFAVGLVLVAYVDSGVNVTFIARSLVVVLGGTLVVLGVARVLTGGWQRAAIVAMGLLAVLRSGSPIHAVAALVLIALVLAAVLLARRMWPTRFDIASFTRTANGLAVILVAVILAGGVTNGTLGRIPDDLRQGASLPEGDGGREDHDEPDVYLFVLDGYPRADTLQRLFDYDNSAFLRELAVAGFDLSSGSRSNYMYTALTLSSMLHGRHVLDLEPGSEPSALRHLINDNAVFDELRSHGYAIVSTASPWDVVSVHNTDYRCGDGPMNGFEFHLLRSSLLMGPLMLVNPDLLADRHRAFIAGAFECANAAMRSPLGAPRFVLVHAGAPHIPIVFDEAGESAPLEYYSDTFQELNLPQHEVDAAYIGQVEYVNGEVLAAADQIIERDPTAAIVIMSDHGSESEFVWGNARLSDFDERFNILFASRTPGHPDLYGPEPTAINTLTKLLNAYLGTDLPEASDTLFFSDPGVLLNLEELDWLP